MDRVGDLYHAIAALPPHQRDALGYVAIGQGGAQHPRTLKALERRGLLACEAVETMTKVGPVTLYLYTVPLPVHIAWCQWCADHEPDEEETDAEEATSP